MTEKQKWETPRLESIDVEKKTGAKTQAFAEYTITGTPVGQS